MTIDFSHLDKPVQFLKGVGPSRAAAFGRAGIATAYQLLHYTPRRYEDASTVHAIGKVEVGMEVTVVGRVLSRGVIPTRSRLRIFQAVVQDDSGVVTCSWPGQPWLERRVREGDRLLLTGPVKFFHGKQIQPREFTLLSRDGTLDEEESADQGKIFVVYPATDELPQWALRNVFERNLDLLLPHLDREEYLSEAESAEIGVLSLNEAMRSVHRPDTLGEAEEGRRRLAFDELFFLQLIQAQARFRQTEARPGITFERTNELIRALHEHLPFTLTEAQTKVIREIYQDMTSARRMSRLLQGDVGSGKTIVALFAMLLALEGGYQAALMAPTELLVEQHIRNLSELVEPLGLEVGRLTGALTAVEREQALGRLRTGEAKIVVGTHALIQEGVEFGRLGLVVVDEQHRFGVRQRMALGESAGNPDVLIMTATPIPRSLAMTAYGDLDLSVLDELPPGREPVRTVFRYPRDRPKVYRWVEEELTKGRQAYIVYPLVDESDKMDLLSATQEYERLSAEVFPDRRVGLLHGKLPSEEKDSVMRAFLAGELDILVATSVIEVGIDVPNATLMVIEHAERFGLSQLHQFRGRVGRGGGESHCVLIADPGEMAEERLKVFTQTNDGFAIARADLRIRGPGDLFGAQQHGRDPIFRHADLTSDEGLLIEAQRRARSLIATDPELERTEHSLIRALLERRHGERLQLFKTG